MPPEPRKPQPAPAVPDAVLDAVAEANDLTPSRLATLKPDRLAALVKAAAPRLADVPPADLAKAAKAYARARGTLI